VSFEKEKKLDSILFCANKIIGLKNIIRIDFLNIRIVQKFISAQRFAL